MVTRETLRPRRDASGVWRSIAICVLIGICASFGGLSCPEESARSPVPQRTADSDEISIFFTGSELGALKPCGCSGGQLGGLSKRMAVFTLLTELAGTVFFVFRFAGDMPWGKAVWTSVFHSVSSFNNAGFDLFGGFRSLTGYAGDPYVLLVTAVLVITGGISFLVIADVFSRRNWTRFSLDTKLVLSGTGILLLGGMIVVLLTETGNPDTLGAMSFPQQLLNAFLQSVITRTAGFATLDVSLLRDYTLFLFMLLMFIGGASGSTAGGIKINTVTILITTIWSTVRGREHAGAFSREFTVQQVYRALAVIIISLLVITVVVFLLTVTEDFRFLDLLFEAFSAFGTVGLTTGITPGLSAAGKILITLTMFIGRLGPLALVLSLVQRQKSSAYRFPEESIRIG